MRGQVWLDPSKTLNGGVLLWAPAKRFAATDADAQEAQHGEGETADDRAIARAASFAGGGSKAAALESSGRGGVFTYGLFPLQRTRVAPEPPRPRWLPEPSSAETPPRGSGSSVVSFGSSRGSAREPLSPGSKGPKKKKKASRRESMAPVRR
jgi:hypothetical protein